MSGKGALTSLVIGLITFRLFDQHGWKIFQPDISVGAWGALIACGGSVILTVASTLSDEKIRLIGEKEAAANGNRSMSVSEGLTMSFFALALTMAYAYCFIIGAITTVDKLLSGDIIHFIANLCGFIVLPCVLVLIGITVTSVPTRLAELLYHARTSPEEFKRITMRRGYQLLVVGSLFQAIAGSTFG